MPVVKSYSVGNGDTFYIQHGSDNFTIIDCCLSDDNYQAIIEDLRSAGKKKISGGSSQRIPTMIISRGWTSSTTRFLSLTSTLLITRQRRITSLTLGIVIASCETMRRKFFTSTRAASGSG